MSDETGTETSRSSVSVEFAELILGELRGRTWSLGFVPERTWNPTYHLEDLLDTRVVCVVPRSIQVTRWTRGSNLHEPIVEIGLMFKPDLVKLLEEETQEALMKAEAILDRECDRQAGLVEQIVDYFNSIEGRTYRGSETRGLKYNLQRCDPPTLISHEYLEQFMQVTSVVRVHGRVVRS